MCGCNRPKNVKTLTQNGVKVRTRSSMSGQGQIPSGTTPTVIRQQNVAQRITNAKLAEKKTKLAEVRKKIIQNKFR